MNTFNRTTQSRRERRCVVHRHFIRLLNYENGMCLL